MTIHDGKRAGGFNVSKNPNQLCVRVMQASEGRSGLRLSSDEVQMLAGMQMVRDTAAGLGWRPARERNQ